MSGEKTTRAWKLGQTRGSENGLGKEAPGLMEDWMWEDLGEECGRGKEAEDFLAKGPVRSCPLAQRLKLISTLRSLV